MEKLWIPFAIFDNTDDNEVVKLDEDVDTTMLVTREGVFMENHLSEVDESYLYEGGENKISLRQTHSKRFQCKYHCLSLLLRFEIHSNKGFSSWLFL